MSFKTTVREWFRTGLRPNESQFFSFFDKICWKDETIPVESIEGIEDRFSEKADDERVTNLFNSLKFIPVGEFLVFKTEIDQPNELLPGMIVRGIVENLLIEGSYLGGSIESLTSFEIYNQLEI